MKSNYVVTRVIKETMLAIVFFSAYISFYNPCSLNPKTNNAWFSLWELSWHHNWLDMFEMQDFNQLSYAILMQIWHINTHTPLKINMESQNRPIAKENPLPNSKPLFLGSMLILQGLTCFTWQPEKTKTTTKPSEESSLCRTMQLSCQLWNWRFGVPETHCLDLESMVWGFRIPAPPYHK